MASFDFDIFDDEGNRKYLNLEERLAYFAAVDKALAKPDDREKRTFALLLYYTGCRISEGLAVTHDNIDYAGQAVTFRTPMSSILSLSPGCIKCRIVTISSYVILVYLKGGGY